MNVFDILGPVMIGPSSSHTAGAARIGFLAQKMINGPLKKVEFTLYGRMILPLIGHVSLDVPLYVTLSLMVRFICAVVSVSFLSCVVVFVFSCVALLLAPIDSSSRLTSCFA